MKPTHKAGDLLLQSDPYGTSCIWEVMGSKPDNFHYNYEMREIFPKVSRVMPISDGDMRMTYMMPCAEHPHRSVRFVFNPEARPME